MDEMHFSYQSPWEVKGKVAGHALTPKPPITCENESCGYSVNREIIRCDFLLREISSLDVDKYMEKDERYICCQCKGG